jgi:hypothetical protein
MANRWHDMSLDDLMQTMGQSQPGSIDYGYASAEFNRRQFKNSQRSTVVSVLSAIVAVISAIAAWTAVAVRH